ncbi:MAG: FadR family transcriptional regulator [Planctomycetaceae bacterium]|nr:FadR family transcriptional regulator [Planctomycetaceae bacterium]
MQTTARYSASQKVVDYLRSNIADGAWKVGEKIPSEHELTRELGVSRTSIRQAIQQFIALGVMESFHGKGTFIVSNEVVSAPGGVGAVSEVECRDVEKVLEFRSILEPKAAFLAAQNATDEVIEQLRRHLNALVTSIGDSEEFVRHDLLFHTEICRASGNPLLERSLREVFALTQQDHKKINTIFGFKDGVYYHSLILKAFESHDPQLVQNLMAEHLEQALEQLRT